MWKSIFLTTLIAGTLDLIAACTNAYFTTQTTPEIILKYIASGVLGPSAFSGGLGVILLGLLFHFFIAFACTFTFFWLYPKLSFLKKYTFFNAVLIGTVAWFVTNIVIIPISKIPTRPLNFNSSLIAVTILILFIGLPIAYSAKNYFIAKN